MRHWKKALLGLVFTVALLWWVLSDVPFSEVAANIVRADPWLLLAATVITTLGFPIRAMRWEVLLRPVRADTGLYNRWVAVAIGFMTNNLTLRVGEFARAWVYSRLEPIKASAAFGTIVVERLLDASVLLVFLVLPVFLPGFPDTGILASETGQSLVKVGAAGVLLILGGLILLVSFPRLFVRMAEAVAPILPSRIGEPLMRSLESFLASLAVMRDPKLLVLGLLWSFFFWAWQAAAFWVGMLAFGIDIGFPGALFTSSVVSFAVALPSTPGFFGPFQAGVVFAVSSVYGFGEAQTLGFAFGYHFATWAPITAIGIGYLWKLGLSIGDVGSADERVDVDVA